MPIVRPSASRLEEFITDCDDVSEAEYLWADAQEFFREYGATRLIYVHLPPIGSPENGGAEVFAWGCEAHRISRYRSQNFYRDDPLVARALRKGDPMAWGDIHRLTGESTGQREVLGFYDGAGFVSVVSVPVFGPGGRNGSVMLGFGDAPDSVPDHTGDSGAGPSGLRAACQAAHLRHCTLRRARLPAPPRLSFREREMLAWVARGKSNGVIAEIMQISPHTVDAYMRRVFLKLGTTDRISAALRALAEGLITGC